MKLKRYVDSLEDVEETFRPLYTEKDGKIVRRDTLGDIEFEGLASAAKIDEMRTTNIKDRQKFEEELAKFKDIDPEKYRELLGKEKDLEDHKLVKRGELDGVRKQAAEEAMKPLKEELLTKEKAIFTLRGQLETAILESKVVEAAMPFGLRKGAAKDLIRRAHEVFRLNEDGELTAYEADGVTLKHHLGDPYSVEQFVKDTSSAEDGKHLFADNAGGGGTPNRGGAGSGDNGEVNPWAKETFNRTKQGEIIKRDRALAERMAKKHGHTLPPLHSTASMAQR